MLEIELARFVVELSRKTVVCDFNPQKPFGFIVDKKSLLRLVDDGAEFGSRARDDEMSTARWRQPLAVVIVTTDVHVYFLTNGVLDKITNGGSSWNI